MTLHLTFKPYTEDEVSAFIKANLTALFSVAMKAGNNFLEKNNIAARGDISENDKLMAFQEVVSALGNEIQVMAIDANFETITALAVNVARLFIETLHESGEQNPAKN